MTYSDYKHLRDFGVDHETCKKVNQLRKDLTEFYGYDPTEVAPNYRQSARRVGIKLD